MGWGYLEAEALQASPAFVPSRNVPHPNEWGYLMARPPPSEGEINGGRD